MITKNPKPKYWLSLEQWADDKTFQKLAGDREFLNPLPVPASNPLAESASHVGGDKGQALIADHTSVPSLERDSRVRGNDSANGNDISSGDSRVRGNDSANGNGISSEGNKASHEGLWDRREFLQLMTAGVALASFGCVRRPTEKIVPYVKRPDDMILGTPNFYSSSYYDGEEGFGLLVKTREGRPIKIEGNKNHPVNQGKLSARAHAHILSLYDPERLKAPQENLFNKEKTNHEKISLSYAKADKEITQKLKAGKTAFLTGEWPSPSSEKLLKSFCQKFSCEHFVWNPLNHSDLAKAEKLCYGQALVPRLALDRARFILSIDCDFLGTWLSPTEFNRLYAKGRKANRDMNCLLVFESLLSLTGSNADERFRIKPSQQLPLVLSLIYSLIQKGFVKAKWPAHLKAPLEPWKSFSITKEKWDKIVKALWDNRGQSLVLTGGPATQHSKAQSLHVAVAWLNHLLKNDGYTIDYQNPYRTWTWANRNIEELIQKLEQNKIDTLIIHKTNPLYTYPDQKRLESAIKKAKLVVYTGDREDETGQLSHYILPDPHDLEKWSDWEFQKGVLSVGQPTIRPLYESRAFEDSLMVWAKEGDQSALLNGASSWYEYMKNQVISQFSVGFSWDRFLETGVFIKNPSQRTNRFPARAFKTSALAFITEEKPSFASSSNLEPSSQESQSNSQVIPALSPHTMGFELVLYTTTGLKDGTLANVPWIQEFPDPVTKICWDNYVCVSPATSRKHALKEGQVVQLKITKGESNQVISIKAPLHIQPGQADGVLALSLGFGHKRAGRVANHVGVNAYPLASWNHKSKNLVLSSLPAKLSPTSKIVPLANTQGHHSMEGRQIVVETTLKKYLQNPGGAIHRHKVFSLWSSHQYPKHKWGMVIDLNSCTGCSACIVACQSENNIPTVGKDLVLQGREMHWIRVDRYYKGEPEKPSAVHQPVVCMHCDNAPCETVCPVLATVHSDEGTNDMIYNRCVGTRYCANNCPYKVRRFNWFNYTKKIEKPRDMALNPEVTVRSRGVMEKCTFCIHRVRSAQAKAKLEGRSLKDGDIQTACQESCPTNAIVFGDLKDKSSEVYRLFHREDSYALLEELNAQPAVRYQVKVRNKEESSAGDHLEHQKNHHG